MHCRSRPDRRPREICGLLQQEAEQGPGATKGLQSGLVIAAVPGPRLIRLPQPGNRTLRLDVPRQRVRPHAWAGHHHQRAGVHDIRDDRRAGTGQRSAPARLACRSRHLQPRSRRVPTSPAPPSWACGRFGDRVDGVPVPSYRPRFRMLVSKTPGLMSFAPPLGSSGRQEPGDGPGACRLPGTVPDQGPRREVSGPVRAILADAGIEVLLTGVRIPRMNSITERGCRPADANSSTAR